MDLGQNWSNIISSNGTANVTSNQSVASNNPAATSPFGGSTEDDSAKNKYKIIKSIKLSQNKNQNPTKRTRKYADLN